MADLFEEKSRDWDANDMVLRLSAGVGASVLEHVPLREDWAVLDFGAGTGLVSAHVAPRVARVVAVDERYLRVEVTPCFEVHDDLRLDLGAGVLYGRVQAHHSSETCVVRWTGGARGPLALLSA